jgi:hypothetical protein
MSGSAGAGGVGGAAAMMPFSSMMLPLLMSFGPAFLNKLFGNDPQRKLRRQINKLTSAGNVGKTTNQFYQQAVGSPAFSQAQGNIAAGANAAQGNLMSSLGQRGIGTSGTGAILSSLMPSVVGQQQAGLRTAAHTGAQNQARQAIQAQIDALVGTQGPSQTQQMFAGGLESFAPYFSAFMKSRYPQFGGAQ